MYERLQRPALLYTGIGDAMTSERLEVQRQGIETVSGEKYREEESRGMAAGRGHESDGLYCLYFTCRGE